MNSRKFQNIITPVDQQKASKVKDCFE